VERARGGADCDQSDPRARLANPPFAPTAHAGRAKGDVKAKVGAEGARTVPPREHGGNCDIKDLSRGSKIYFPVYVPGGGLSMGDLHFSQGDGEITFCGAIEMAGWLHLKVDVIKDGVAKVQPVKVDRTSQGMSVISEGLTGDESVVVDGQLLLSDGSRVEPRAKKAGA